MAADPTVQILGLIRPLIAEYTDVPAEAIVPEARLDELQVDSLTLADLLFEMEDKLGAEIAEPTERPQTVSDLIRLVEPYAHLLLPAPGRPGP